MYPRTQVPRQLGCFCLAGRSQRWVPIPLTLVCLSPEAPTVPPSRRLSTTTTTTTNPSSFPVGVLPGRRCPSVSPASSGQVQQRSSAVSSHSGRRRSTIALTGLDFLLRWCPRVTSSPRHASGLPACSRLFREAPRFQVRRTDGQREKKKRQDARSPRPHSLFCLCPYVRCLKGFQLFRSCGPTGSHGLSNLIE